MSRVIGRGRYATETYPQSPGAGGGAASGNPLSRQRFIDGDTNTPGPGAASAPFKTIAVFIASRGNASVADANANYVGWLMPALNGYVENVAFPPYASTEVRADSFSNISGAGVTITGNVTWANVAGAFAATAAFANLHNVSLTGSFAVTDDAGAPPSGVNIGGDEIAEAGVDIGSFDSTATTKLQLVSFQNVLIGDIHAGADTPGSGNRAVVLFTNSECNGTSVTARGLSAADSVFNVSAITVNAAGNATFFSCEFFAGSNPVLTCLAGAQFDGPSWRSFSEAGGTRAAGTVVLVTGGYSAGSVEGAALTGAATNVSLNGAGATAGYTGEHSGNHYSSASNTPTSVTLETGGALIGDTMLITRTTFGTGVLAVINGGVGAGTLGTIPVNAHGFVLARFDGTNWVFAQGGSMLA